MMRNPIYLKFLFIRILTSMSFILPVRVAWLIHYNMREGDISAFKVIFSLTVSFFEIPTGIVSDVISRRLSMAISAALFAIHAVFYIICPNFFGFAMTQVFLGLSTSFMSGADTAYLHTYLKKHTDHLYAGIRGKLELIGKVFSAIYSVASSVIYASSPKAVFLLSFTMGIIAIGVILSLPEEDMHRTPLHLIRLKHFWDTPLAAMRIILRSRAMINITLSTAVVFSLLIFNFEMYQVKFNNIGLPVGYNGFIYAGFMILMGLGGNIAKHLLNRMSSIFSIATLIFFVALSFIVFGISDNIMIIAAAIIMQQISFGCWEIIVNNYILDNCKEDHLKSTISSMNSLIVNLFKGGIIALLGIIAQTFSLNAVYIGMGVIMPFIAVLLLYRPHRAEGYE